MYGGDKTSWNIFNLGEINPTGFLTAAKFASSAKNIEKALKLQRYNGAKWNIVKTKIKSKSDMEKALKKAFQKSCEGDYLWISYSGHGGHSNSVELNGSLIPYAENYIKPADIKTMLDKYSGAKFIFLGSCYSGAIVNYFRNAGDSSYNVVSAVGAQETACGLLLPDFENALCEAGGWSPTYSRAISLAADVNQDKKVSLLEAVDFTRKRMKEFMMSGDKQNLQWYSNTSTFTIFSR
jgi:hypothetical protein